MDDILRLFDCDLIPSCAVWSKRQQEILDRLVDGDGEDDVRALARFGMQAVDPNGGCDGIAYAVRGGTVLPAVFLESILDFVIGGHPDDTACRPCFLKIVDRIDAGLRNLTEREAYRYLAVPPRSVHNRVLNFHCMIAGAPAYRLVAARLQRGIVAKVRQLADLDPEAADRRLGGFLQAVIPIVWSIPEADARPVSGKIPDNFDHIVRTAILHMRRKRAGRYGNTRYAPSSYKVFWNNWEEMFNARAGEKSFHPRSVASRKPSSFTLVRGSVVEGSPCDQAREEMLARIAELESQEKKGIGRDRCRMSIAGAVKSRGRLDPGRAVVMNTPSSTMPGSRPRVVLALINAGLDALQDEWPALNAASARVLVNCMLYLGRRPEWLLRMRLGRRPSSVRDCTQPVMDPVRYAVYHRPEKYPGLSKALRPPSRDSKTAWKDFGRAWKTNDAAYEQVDLLQTICLPPPLDEEVRSLLAARRKAIRGFTRRGKVIDQDRLFFWQERTRIVPLTMEHIERILKRLTEFLRQQIPSCPFLQPMHLCRSFEGHFAEHGLRPEIRYFISGRSDPEARVPLGYSRVSSKSIRTEHALTSNAIHCMIRREREAIGFPTRIESHIRATPPSDKAADESFMGSASCARLDLIRMVLSELQDAVSSPEVWDPDLPNREALCNARTRLAAVGLALLSGIRPLELPRLRGQDFDPRGLWIAVRGKARPHEAAYRRVPVLPGMCRLLEEIMKGMGGSNHPKRQLLGFYRNGSGWNPAQVGDLEAILIEAGERQGLKVLFDLYGLRHRFRSDCLQAGLPFRMINFLMGHETAGFEPYGIYQDAGPGRIQETYQETVPAIAESYGWAQ